MTKKFASGRYSKAVCDRSGFVFPYNEMVLEPGTNLLVHYSESDGMYSRVCHPQNFVPKNLSDAVALRNPRPERREDTDALNPFLQDSADSTPLLDNHGHEILVNRTYPIRADN